VAADTAAGRIDADAGPGWIATAARPATASDAVLTPMTSMRLRFRTEWNTIAPLDAQRRAVLDAFGLEAKLPSISLQYLDDI
jgi:hypothetical protein